MKLGKVLLLTFDELDRDMQEKVVEKMRDINVGYVDWWDYLIDNFIEDCKKIGVDVERDEGLF